MGKPAILAILVVAVLVGLVGCRQADSPTLPLAATPLPAPSVPTPVFSTTPSYDTPTPLPTIARPVPPTATATTGAATMTAIAALPTCRAADLAIVEGGENAAMGMRFHILYFWNRGAEPCSLVGSPGVAFLDQHGATILDSEAKTAPEGLNPYTGAPFGIVVLLPGLDRPIPHHGNGPGYALVEISTSTSSLNAGICTPLQSDPRQMRLTLPASYESIVIDWEIGTCDRRFAVMPFH